MNKCDPFYCEDLTRGHIFWCRTFCGGGLAGGRVVGLVGVEWGGLVVVGVRWVEGVAGAVRLVKVV